MTRNRLEPFFLDGAAGRIFLLLHAAAEARKCVLIVPPFAEEMNKCRRQYAETAHALVEEGFAVLLLDLFGTGDSEGEFAGARWDIWKSDVDTAFSWIERSGLEPYALIGARLGCALAAETLRDYEKSVEKSVFWQPVAKGRQFMTQFLRLRVASSMMEGRGQETVESLRARLYQDESISVAGYELSPELARAIDGVDLLKCHSQNLGKLAVLEVSTTSSEKLSVASQRILSSASEFGIEANGRRFVGEPFWSATEIVVNPQLRDATVNIIEADLT